MTVCVLVCPWVKSTFNLYNCLFTIVISASHSTLNISSRSTTEQCLHELSSFLLFKPREVAEMLQRTNKSTVEVWELYNTQFIRFLKNIGSAKALMRKCIQNFRIHKYNFNCSNCFKVETKLHHFLLQRGCRSLSSHHSTRCRDKYTHACTWRIRSLDRKSHVIFISTYACVCVPVCTKQRMQSLEI